MNPIVIVIGEHPHEASAFYLGKKVYERLQSASYNVSLERMPVELTPVGSVVKGLEPVDEKTVRLDWLRELYGRYGAGAFYFHFHNSRYDPTEDEKPEIETMELSRVGYPPVEEFKVYKGFAFELPAIWRQTRNKRFLEYGHTEAKDEVEWIYEQQKGIIRRGLEKSRTLQEQIPEIIEQELRYLRELAEKSGLRQMTYKEHISFLTGLNTEVVDFVSTSHNGLVGDSIIKKSLEMILGYIDVNQ